MCKKKNQQIRQQLLPYKQDNINSPYLINVNNSLSISISSLRAWRKKKYVKSKKPSK